MTGLNESECGQILVRQNTSQDGCTIDPPADKLYAVDPVGVEIMIPSPLTVVRGTSFTKISNLAMNSASPLDITTSFNAWNTAGKDSYPPSELINLRFT